MKRKFIAIFIAAILSVNFLSCGGAGNSEKGKVTEESAKGTEIDVLALKKKYASKEKVNYNEPLYNLKRNHVFEFELEKEVAEKYKENLNEVVGVYLDVDCKIPVEAKLSYDEESKKIKVEPPRVPVFYNDEDFSESRTDINVNDFDIETTRENNLDWGNANNYYLVNNIDGKTGKKLDKPEVTIFTIKPELNTPTAEFYLSPTGKAGIKWNGNEATSKYIVYSIAEDSESKNYKLNEEASTKKTNFEDFLGSVVDFDGMVVSTNTPFDITDGKSEKYCIMAISEDKKSLMSNIIDTKDYASQVPISPDREKNSELFKGDKLSEFPTHLYVKMGDGSNILTPVDFDRNYLEFINHEKHGLIAEIRYKLRGTSLVENYYIKVDKEDEATKEQGLKILKELQDRQEKIKWNGLNSSVEVGVESTPPADMEESKTTDSENKPSEEVKKEKVEIPDENIYASSALGEYIALNMLNGKEKINLSEFPEASNKDILLDSFYEAMYQNPMVMSIKAVGFNYKTNELLIEYGQTAEKQKEMQKKVREEVKKVTSEVIKEGMTDIEKEFAINKYLCDNAKYDDAALKSAMDNDMIPDEKFNNSFTPYGVLVDKVGVCASYAGAFKLLSEAAGLQSVVVTGNLNGSLPHAWNRVLIDEQWMTLDSTNNDNENIPNALLNLPDDISKSVLVEDDKFLLDERIEGFKGEKEELEYYKVKDKFFNSEEAVDNLAMQLKETGFGLIRTDYDITQEEAAAIVVKACKKAGVTKIEDANSWLGVISVKVKK